MHQEEKEQAEERRERLTGKKRRTRSEAVRIQSKKVCCEAVIQSAAEPTLPQEDKEQAQERDIDIETERERVRASDVKGSLLRSRQPAGSENEKEREQRCLLCSYMSGETTLDNPLHYACRYCK
jgi:hypothetical protein